MVGSRPGHPLGAKRLRESPKCGKAADKGHFRAGEALAVGTKLSNLWGWRVPGAGWAVRDGRRMLA